MRHLASAAALAATLLTAPASEAQPYGALDPQIAGMMDQMITYFHMACQAGNYGTCQAIPAAMAQAQAIAGAAQSCAMGNQNACVFYRDSAMGIQQAYMQMQRQMAMTPPAPGYDPMNPIAPTHDGRIGAITAWGEANTRRWEEQQRRQDEAHRQQLGVIAQ